MPMRIAFGFLDLYKLSRFVFLAKLFVEMLLVDYILHVALFL